MRLAVYVNSRCLGTNWVWYGGRRELSAARALKLGWALASISGASRSRTVNVFPSPLRTTSRRALGGSDQLPDRSGCPSAKRGVGFAASALIRTARSDPACWAAHAGAAHNRQPATIINVLGKENFISPPLRFEELVRQACVSTL